MRRSTTATEVWTRGTAGQWLLLALWFALLTGLVEAGLLAVARYRLGRYTHLPADLIWISPLASALLFGVLAGLLILGGALVPRLRSRKIALFIFGFVACLDGLLLVTQIHQAAAVVLAIGVATQMMRLGDRHWNLLQRVVRYTVAPLVVAAVAGGAAFHLIGRGAERSALANLAKAARGSPNVLLIIWDTVRAEELSVFGYSRHTTPVLERIAREGVAFDHAIANAPWTLPSHASLMTGAYPHELGADWTVPLGGNTRTLAEFLRQHGYNTAGFVANTYYCSSESGLDRGFIHYEDFRRVAISQIIMGSAVVRAVFSHDEARHVLHWHEEPGRKNAQRMNEDLLKWLDGNGGHPFFAFVNYFDGHAPYLPPAPFDTLFGPRLPGRNPLISENREMSAEELRAERDAYDGAIAYLDHSLGQLLDALKARGILDNTVIVVAADHGEQFGEHGLVSHGNSLYLPLLHVPLLIRAPGRVPEGVRISEWVGLRNVAVTVAELVSAQYRGAFPGSSLARYWSESPTSGVDTLLSEVSRVAGMPAKYPVSRGDMKSVLAAPHQFIANSDGAEELYDVLTDPGETRNLISSRTAPSADAFRSFLGKTSAWAQQ